MIIVTICPRCRITTLTKQRRREKDYRLEYSYNTDHTESDKVSQINRTRLWAIFGREI